MGLSHECAELEGNGKQSDVALSNDRDIVRQGSGHEVGAA